MARGVREELKQVDEDGHADEHRKAQWSAESVYEQEEIMKTQSIDTSPEAERVLIALLRQKGVSRRFQLTASMSRSVMVASRLNCQQQYPDFTEQEAMFFSARYSWGQTLVDELRQAAEQRRIFPTFSTIELQAAFFPVVRTLEQMGITCALTGSLARSIYGMQRTLSQGEVLADLANVDATCLQELLPLAFYIRGTDRQAALRERTSITSYHLPSLFSVQVAFLRPDLGHSAMLTRTRRLTLIEGEPALPVLAPEDISILALADIQQEQAELVRRGRTEEPDDLWNELLGVLKVQGPELDLQCIEQQARALGLLDEMQRAFEDAGLRE
jgi:hypothetical protein